MRVCVAGARWVAGELSCRYCGHLHGGEFLSLVDESGCLDFGCHAMGTLMLTPEQNLKHAAARLPHALTLR